MSLVSGRMDVKELRRVLSIFSHFANTSSYVDTYIGSKKCPTQLGAFQCSKDPPPLDPSSGTHIQESILRGLCYVLYP